MTAATWPNRLQATAAANDKPSFVADRALAGGLAVLLWSLSPVLALWAFPVPPLLLLGLAFGTAFLVHAARRRLAGGQVADLFGAPFAVMAVALIGIAGSSLCYVLALGLAADAPAAIAAHVAPHVAPVGIVLAGMLLLALCAAGVARRGGALADLLGGVCGVAAPLCLMLHLGLEPRLPFTAGNLLAAAALGLGPIGLAGILWDRVRRGSPATGRR